MTDRPSRLKLTVRDPVRDGRQSSRGSAAGREEPPGRATYPPFGADAWSALCLLSAVQIRTFCRVGGHQGRVSTGRWHHHPATGIRCTQFSIRLYEWNWCQAGKRCRDRQTEPSRQSERSCQPGNGRTRSGPWRVLDHLERPVPFQPGENRAVMTGSSAARSAREAIRYHQVFPSATRNPRILQLTRTVA